jgi:hypothetical protein
MGTLSQWAARMLALGAMLLGAASRTEADPISFHLTSIQITTTSGSTVTFDGTVTNNSGGALNASDFFFNFFGFDPNSVTPIQDLGVSTDFLILNGSTSHGVPLFDITLGSVPTGSMFSIQVQLEDINSDLSGVQTVMVNVPASSTTPEPATIVLFGTGLFLVTVKRRSRLADKRIAS